MTLYIDWIVFVNIFAVVLLIALLVALVMRYSFRSRLYNSEATERFTEAQYPIAVLNPDGSVEDIWVNANNYVVFGGIVQKCKQMRHGLCTDTPGWYQYVLLCSGNVMKKLLDPQDSTAVSSQPLSSFVAEEIEKSADAFVNFLNKTLPAVSDNDDRERQLETSKKVIRGVANRKIPHLNDDVFLADIG